jgi:hypothetical protein
MIATYPPTRAEESTAPLLVRSRDRMAALAEVCLELRVPGFRGRSIAALVDPQQVSPAALAQLERAAGPALWTSPHWKQVEGIRIVALAGLREAEQPSRAAEWTARSRTWMTGATARAA